MIKKISAIVAICVLGLATAVLSVLLLVNAGMNGYSPYGDTAANKLDAAAEYSAAAMMPKIADIGIEVKRDGTFNFGKYSAYMYYTTVHNDKNQSVVTDETPRYISQFGFRGDKYLAGKTKTGGAPAELEAFGGGSIYRVGNFLQTYSSYKEDDTLYYAAFYFLDPAANTVRTVSEIKNKYVDEGGNKVVSFVGYKTSDKEDDIVIGVYAEKKTFLNPLTGGYADGNNLEIINVILGLQDKDATAMKLLENLNFFGKNVKLDLAARKAYVESQNGKPEVLMISVIATGAQIKYMESAYPELKLFEAVEKVR